MLVAYSKYEFLFSLDAENESFQVLVNEWDYGEGRLRPRRASKSKTGPEAINKVKCDVCNKFFRAEYIKVCSLCQAIEN
jgi:hypothetical protein